MSTIVIYFSAETGKTRVPFYFCVADKTDRDLCVYLNRR